MPIRPVTAHGPSSTTARAFFLVSQVLRARLYVQLRQQILADRAQATPVPTPLRAWKVVRATSGRG